MSTTTFWGSTKFCSRIICDVLNLKCTPVESSRFCHQAHLWCHDNWADISIIWKRCVVHSRKVCVVPNVQFSQCTNEITVARRGLVINEPLYPRGRSRWVHRNNSTNVPTRVHVDHTVKASDPAARMHLRSSTQRTRVPVVLCRVSQFNRPLLGYKLIFVPDYIK